jgi:hypothetical protein
LGAGLWLKGSMVEKEILTVVRVGAVGCLSLVEVSPRAFKGMCKLKVHLWTYWYHLSGLVCEVV